MKKIPDEIDNPIDNILIRISDYLCPIFKKLGHTPNMITTWSLFFGLLSVYLLYKGYVYWFAITYMISYFFDCMDGHFARKYKMTSKFGDYYDHIKDIFVYLLVIYVIYIKYKHILCISDFIIIGLSLFACFTHIGCQQKYQDKNGEILDNFQPLCTNKDMIYYTRYFGMGTMNLLFVFLVIMIDYRCKSYLKL